MYSSVSTTLADLDDTAFRKLIGRHESAGGWGETKTVALDDTKLFVKRIPVTDLEFDHRRSTRNLYEIPPFYNYGVGSAGFGVFRELMSHVATTNWVLEEAVEGLPLTYHHRILDLDDAWGTVPDRHDGYVAYWNGEPGIDRYMQDRAAALRECVVVLEHFPSTLDRWLLEHPSQVDDVVGQLVGTIGFLHSRGVAHFDAHFGNVVTDGRMHHLVDYGLACDEAFELDDVHREFLHAHWHYDYGEVLHSVGAQLAWMFIRLPRPEQSRLRQALGLKEDAQYLAVAKAMLEQLTKVRDTIELDPALAAAIERYRGVIEFMGDFFTKLQANPRKDTPFDDAKLRSLLSDAGVPVEEARRQYLRRPRR